MKPRLSPLIIYEYRGREGGGAGAQFLDVSSGSLTNLQKHDVKGFDTARIDVHLPGVQGEFKHTVISHESSRILYRRCLGLI